MRKTSILIKYFDPEMPKVEKFSVGDWVDLRSRERVEMKKGEIRIIALGVGMILPENFEAIIAPRSSTPIKYKILMANSIGIIDNSYSGNSDEWGFIAYALEDTVIEKYDRICQFRILHNMPSTEFIEVSELNSDSRGGYGSTGQG